MPDGQRGRPDQGFGRRGVPPENCVCPRCGYQETKRLGVPCREMQCPKCGTTMVGK